MTSCMQLLQNIYYAQPSCACQGFCTSHVTTLCWKQYSHVCIQQQTCGGCWVCIVFAVRTGQHPVVSLFCGWCCQTLDFLVVSWPVCFSYTESICCIARQVAVYWSEAHLCRVLLISLHWCLLFRQSGWPTVRYVSSRHILNRPCRKVGLLPFSYSLLSLLRSHQYCFFIWADSKAVL